MSDGADMMKLLLLVLIASAVAGALFWVLYCLLWRLLARSTKRSELRRLARSTSVVPDEHLRARELAIVAASAVLVPFVVLVPSPREARVAIFALGLLIWIAAWMLHGAPGHSRVVKYLAIILGSGGVAELFFILQPLPPATIFGVVFAAWTSLVAIAALLYAIFRLGALRPLAATDPSVHRTRSWYRRVMWLQGPDLWSLVAWFALSNAGFGLGYLILRFCARARIGQRPILYLRSFSNADAARVFSEVIMPALHRQCVVSGLVHTKQTSSALHRDVPVLWRASFGHISDEHWRSWVQARLESGGRAIIDVSTASESIQWEMETAMRLLGTERVLVLPPTTERADDKAAAQVAAWTSVVLDSITDGGRRVDGLVHLPGYLESPLAPAASDRVTRRRHQLSTGVLSIVPALATGAFVISVLVGELKEWYVRDTNEIQRSIEWGDVRMVEQLARLQLRGLCPRDPRELLPPGQERDGWGRYYVVLCGDDAPPQARGLGVVSLGPDGLLGTEDDVSSWSPRP